MKTAIFVVMVSLAGCDGVATTTGGETSGSGGAASTTTASSTGGTGGGAGGTTSSPSCHEQCKTLFPDAYAAYRLQVLKACGCVASGACESACPEECAALAKGDDPGLSEQSTCGVCVTLEGQDMSTCDTNVKKACLANVPCHNYVACFLKCG